MSGCCDGCSEIYKQRSYIQHHSKFSSLTMLSFELVKSGYQVPTEHHTNRRLEEAKEL
jgi:hypothetical protein